MEVAVSGKNYSEILSHRNEHAIFLRLEELDGSQNEWYYVDELGDLHSPKDASEMDRLFAANALSESSLVGTDPLEEEAFSPFTFIMRRYYKFVFLKVGKGNADEFTQER